MKNGKNSFIFKPIQYLLIHVVHLFALLILSPSHTDITFHLTTVYHVLLLVLNTNMQRSTFRPPAAHTNQAFERISTNTYTRLVQCDSHMGTANCVLDQTMSDWVQRAERISCWTELSVSRETFNHKDQFQFLLTTLCLLQAIHADFRDKSASEPYQF